MQQKPILLRYTTKDKPVSKHSFFSRKLRMRESSFDLRQKLNSKIKQYDALEDPFTFSYFSSPSVRTHLKKLISSINLEKKLNERLRLKKLLQTNMNDINSQLKSTNKNPQQIDKLHFNDITKISLLSLESKKPFKQSKNYFLKRAKVKSEVRNLSEFQQSKYNLNLFLDKKRLNQTQKKQNLSFDELHKKRHLRFMIFLENQKTTIEANLNSKNIQKANLI